MANDIQALLAKIEVAIINGQRIGDIVHDGYISLNLSRSDKAYLAAEVLMSIPWREAERKTGIALSSIYTQLMILHEAYKT